MIHADRPRWFVFGEHSDGTVDVADRNGDIAINVPREAADALIARYNELADELDEAS